jgi:hypothetical protein
MMGSFIIEVFSLVMWEKLTEVQEGQKRMGILMKVVRFWVYGGNVLNGFWS